MNSSATARIDKAFQRENWPAARMEIEKELAKNPDEHWLYARLSSTYYEEKKYGKALLQAKRASKLAPHCPLVLWDLAGALAATGAVPEALRIYKSLMKKGVDKIGEDECSEGPDWIASLLIDCLYRAALCYRELGKTTTSLKFLRQFIRLRSEWHGGIYRLEDASKIIGELATATPKQMAAAIGKVARSA